LDYVYEDVGGFATHVLIVDSDANGVARYHIMPSRGTEPDRAMIEAMPSMVQFMGVILSESQAPGGGGSYRRRNLPNNLLERVNALEPGDREAFMVRHDTFLNGQRQVFNQEHAITLLGCSTFVAPDGAAWPTRIYEVETASRVVPSGVQNSRIQVEFIAALGWAVRTVFEGEPEARLVNVTPLP
jgi:hypothetical protein